MILLWEQDTCIDDESKFLWKPCLFKGYWRNKKTWRIAWGFWSISYYPEKRISTFTKYIEDGNTEWFKDSQY